MDNRQHYTTPVSSITPADCAALIALALDEDAPAGDPTSEAIFPPTQESDARVVSREEGILCGVPVLALLFSEFQKRTGRPIHITESLSDGDAFSRGGVLLSAHGAVRDLLRLERPLLNFLQYLSGIATTVHQAVERAPANVAVLDTRKTLPGYRRLAKYAVYCGGGTNHRIHLSDMAMIKDNHVAAAGGIGAAAERIHGAFPSLPLEIEIDSLSQLDAALKARPRVILLDNMEMDAIRSACRKISELPEAERPMIEVSGGWKPDRLKDLAGLGPVGVSMGFLTHTTRFLDLSLEIGEA